MKRIPQVVNSADVIIFNHKTKTNANPIRNSNYLEFKQNFLTELELVSSLKNIKQTGFCQLQCHIVLHCILLGLSMYPCLALLVVSLGGILI